MCCTCARCQEAHAGNGCPLPCAHARARLLCSLWPQAERQQVDALCLQRDSLAAEVEAAEAACVREEVEQAVLASQVHAAEQQLAVHQLQARAAFSLSPGWYGL